MSTAAVRVNRARAELLPLTGIRFFAAAFVVVYHFWMPFLAAGTAMNRIFSAGYAAVGFFFLLSGFVLTYSYAGRMGAGRARQFWFARWARIYPAYLLAFLLAAPVQIAGSIHVNGVTAAAKKLIVGGLLHLTLLQAWTPWTAWYWNIPAWSLSAEAFFYLCFPFLLVPVLRLGSKHAWAVAILVFAAALAAPGIYCFIGHPAAQPPLPAAQLAIEVNPLLRLPEFVAGMLLGQLFNSGWRLSRRAATWGPLAAVIAGCTLLAACSVPRPLLAGGLLLPISGFLVLALAHGTGPLASFLSLPPLRIGGEASYGIYILQMPVAGVLGVLPGVVVPGTGQWWRLALFAVILVAVAVGSHFLIETPIREGLNSWFRARRKATKIPSAEPVLAEGNV